MATVMNRQGKAACAVCCANGSGGISLEGHLVRLRPYQEDDLPFLYELRNDTSSLYLWSGRRELVSPFAFRDELKYDEQNGMLRLIIEKRSGGDRLGMVFSYDHARSDRHCSIATVLRPQVRQRGYGAEATALFLRYLFAYMGLEKVYAMVYEYNRVSRKTLEHGGFKLEGVFPHHRFWNGRWWTMFQYAFYRDNSNHLEQILARFCPNQRRNAHPAPSVANPICSSAQHTLR
jgi:RimJ/RimL family protein N-acetyltransferase